MFWNPKVRHQRNKIPPMETILCLFNPNHPLNVRFNIILLSASWFPNFRFLRDFSTKMVVILSFTIRLHVKTSSP